MNKSTLEELVDLQTHAINSGDNVSYFNLYLKLIENYDIKHDKKKILKFPKVLIAYQKQRHEYVYNQCWDIFEYINT